MSVLRRWNGSAWEDVTNYGVAAPTAGGVAYGAGTAQAYTPAGTAGQVLASGGAGAPTWANSGVPVGVIEMLGGVTVPAGWAACDGSSVLRTLYPALSAYWAAEPTPYPYGSVDGTHMTLPSFSNMFPRGNTPGATGGEATHVLTAGEMPAHSHVPAVGTVFLQGGGGGTWNHLTSGTNTANVDIGYSTGNTGGGGAHNNLPPYMGVNFIIKT